MMSSSYRFTNFEATNVFLILSSGGDLGEPGSAEFYSLGNWKLENDRGHRGTGSLWHPYVQCGPSMTS